MTADASDFGLGPSFGGHRLTLAEPFSESPSRARALSMGQERSKASVPASAPPAAHAADPATLVLNETMDRYARGEDRALNELYRRAAPRVRAFLARMCADLALADDLTQEAFMRIASARGSFVAGAPALPWMLAIARNAFRDHVRREQVRRNYRAETVTMHTSRSPQAPHDSGERTVAARQMLGLVQEVLMTLPVRQREAFILMRFEGLSLVQAAGVLGTTEAAVKILVFRAYSVVRTALDSERSKG